MMYKSQFRKIDPYDWFCGPGSHIRKHFTMSCVSSAAEQNETLRQGYYEILFNMRRSVTLLHMSKMNTWSGSRLSSHLHLNTKAQRDSARPSFWSWQALSLILTSSGLRLRLDLLKWPFSAVCRALPVL